MSEALVVNLDCWLDQNPDLDVDLDTVTAVDLRSAGVDPDLCTPDRELVREWLQNRNIDDSVRESFGLELDESPWPGANGRRMLAIRIPFRGVDGTEVSNQRRALRWAEGDPALGNVSRWATKPGPSSWWGLDSLAHLDDRSVVVLTEGPTDGLTVAGALPGASVIAPPGANKSIPKEALDLLMGRTIFVAGDNDEAGRQHVDKMTEQLQGAGADVIQIWPPAQCGDVNDWAVHAGDRFAGELCDAMTDPVAPSKEAKAPASRPLASSAVRSRRNDWDNESPGDQYDNDPNARRNMEDLLSRYRWVHSRGNEWARPDRDPGGDGNGKFNTDEAGTPIFTVYTAKAPPLELGRTYGPFNLLVELEFDGSHRRAAEHLAAERRRLAATQTDLAIVQSATDTRAEEATAKAAPDRMSATAIADVEVLPGTPSSPTGFEQLGRWSNGGSVFDEPESVPSLWGDSESEEVLWAEGEPFMIFGPQGTGKTTLAQQLLLHMLEIRSGPFLGFDVQPVERVLYLAMDRPRQAKRSIRRMVDPAVRDQLDERLAFWSGPPPARIEEHPTLLVQMAEAVGADTIVVDSVKDLASPLTDETVGAAVNQAFQYAIAEGLNVLALHHPRKSGNDNSDRKCKSVDDIYGSTWITSGLGSIVGIHGKPGDPIVELTHMKQPAAEVAPFKVNHDHENGVSTRDKGDDPLAVIANYPHGIDAPGLAQMLYQTSTPTRAEKQKARRQLTRLEGHGLIERIPDSEPIRWRKG